jgi:serine/threonine protein kinase
LLPQVSDFGLSRVEDDDVCGTFPFNSCGTAAYVAPEALITTKKVNASVDVYAFGGACVQDAPKGCRHTFAHLAH